MTREDLIERLADGAAEVRRALAGITKEELDRRPGPNAWTAREVVHHLADSETTAYVRLRRVLAEPKPFIQAYDENEFARRLHYDRPIDASLALLDALRTANVELLRRLDASEWERAGMHSESGPYSVHTWLAIYADYAHSHADQIRRDRRGDL